MVEKILTASRIKHLPIVNDKGVLVGLITLSDLYRTCSPRKKPEDGSYFYTTEQLNQYILRHVMTKDPFTLKAHSTLLEAMQNMVVGNFGCVPVVDDKKMIVGIITQTDIIRAITGVLNKA
jgi:CBS domain-containing protein